MGARLYNPTTGHFLQVDPVFAESCNPYDYTCQDPVRGVQVTFHYLDVIGREPVNAVDFA